MKATYHSQYRKPTGLQYVYKVTGTAKELEQYRIVQEAQSGKGAGTWPEADGSPLFFVSVANEMRNGNVPEMQYALIFNNDNTRIIRDNSAAEHRKYASIAEKKEAAMAELMAKIELGLIEVPRFNRTLPSTQTAPQSISGEKKGLVDEIIDMSSDGKPVLVDTAGEEELTD